jgi:hypothetical protein
VASTTDLGKWMLTNGGEYNPETAYEQLTMVMYENSTYITLKTVQGITPTDDHINYQLMAKGFNPTALASVQAEDTSGVLGEVGGTVSAQDLINWVVDQAATKLLKISDLVSVQTNDATKGVSAALAYAMGQKLDQLNSNLQHGSVDITLAVNKEEEHEVVFPYKFAKIPTVMVSIERNGYTSSATVMVRKGSVTTSGFKFTSINSESINAEVMVSWFAIAK